MPKLSVVIITYNEEKNIARCLESVHDLADDIVIVDSYSTDKTGEICQKLGARFMQHRFDGYIEQKNWAITQAKYPHILSLDADEALSDRLKESIRQVKINWTHDGYYFNRLTNYCGKWIRHGSWYPSHKLRLWDSRLGAWRGLNPHDRFRMLPDARIKFLKGDLLHFSYYTLNEHLHQITNFTDVVARSYHRAGFKAHFLKITVNPAWRFFRDYFIKLGFLDGTFGYIIALNSAYETFLKYLKLRQIYEKEGSLPLTRICFINSTPTWGGGEKWHHDMALALRERGWEVVMITNRKSELYNRIKHSSLNVYNIRITNLSFLNLYKIWQVAWILRRERVRTTILNLSSDLKAAGISAKLAGVRNIIYRRGLAVPIRNSWFNRFLFRRIITSIIANSGEIHQAILQNNPHLISETKIKLIYNGIDLEVFDRANPEPIYKKESNEVVIGNAGRLSEEKGQQYLIDLARELKARNLKFTILIAGSGKREASLKALASAQGVEQHVRFLGFVENIRSFNSSIDIFILTSKWEGFPFVLVEAMAARKPVIAFEIQSASEIVVHGETGFLVPKANIPELARRVEQLASDTELCQRMGSEGRKRVEELFEFTRGVEKVENLIR